MAEESGPGTTAATTAHGPVILVAATAALGGFLFGYDTAVINGTVDAVQSEFGISDVYLGFVVSSALLGCAVGAWFAGPIADRYGRIRVMLMAAVLFAVSAIASALSWGPLSLMAWRIIGGIAIGAASVIAPAYIAEIAPAHIRGRLGSMQQLAIVTGIFTSLLVDYAIAASAGGASEPVPWGGTAWRWMFASAAVPAVVYGVLALQIPESPRYLLKINQLARARDVLLRFIGGNVDGQIRDIKRTLAGPTDVVKLTDLRGPRFGLLPIVWVGILLCVFQQFVGINVIFLLFDHAVARGRLLRGPGAADQRDHECDEHPDHADCHLTHRQNRAPAAAAHRRGRHGRHPWHHGRVLLRRYRQRGRPHPRAYRWQDCTRRGESLCRLGMSWGPVVWVLLGEMFNNRTRATALAVAAAAQWVANWLISTTFPVLAGVGLSLAYGLYTGFALLAFIFVIKAVRETKGRELEEM